MIKLVVFDWNGTLLADTRACYDADRFAIMKMGGRPLTLSHFRRLWFPNNDYLIRSGVKRKYIEDNPDLWGKLFHPFYEKRVKRARTRAGVRDLLSYLRKAGIESIILSNHVKERIDEQIIRLGIRDCFSAVLASDHFNNPDDRIPKIERLREYMKKEGIPPAEVLIIGDSPEEPRIARELGMKSMVISDGFCSRDRLRDSRPDYIISSMSKAIGIISRES